MWTGVAKLWNMMKKTFGAPEWHQHVIVDIACTFWQQSGQSSRLDRGWYHVKQSEAFAKQRCSSYEKLWDKTTQLWSCHQDPGAKNKELGGKSFLWTTKGFPLWNQWPCLLGCFRSLSILFLVCFMTVAYKSTKHTKIGDTLAIWNTLTTTLSPPWMWPSPLPLSTMLRWTGPRRWMLWTRWDLRFNC